MKTVTHYETARDKLLHVETAGGIVNIRTGLIDSDGRLVTAISIIPDDASRGGDGRGYVWDLETGDYGARLIRREIPS